MRPKTTKCLQCNNVVYLFGGGGYCLHCRKRITASFEGRAVSAELDREVREIMEELREAGELESEMDYESVLSGVLMARSGAAIG